MPRSFDMATEYQGSVEQVHQAFGDEAYWLARLADSGADDATLDSLSLGVDGEPGAILVQTTQVLRSDRLPGVISQFHPGDLRIIREERWTPVRDGRATGTVTGTIPGAPASLGGTMTLDPAKPGSRQEFKISVEVRVPLVGGKIENLIGTGLMDLVIAEQRFTTAWIAETA